MKNEKVRYSDMSSLRYSHLMLMTDQVCSTLALRISELIARQDHDGSHIKGSLIKILDYFYPSLLKLTEFLVEFVMPIVQVGPILELLAVSRQRHAG